MDLEDTLKQMVDDVLESVVTRTAEMYDYEQIATVELDAIDKRLIVDEYVQKIKDLPKL